MKDGSNRLLTTATLNLNQWYHIVYQRASGTLYGFLDGVSLGTISMTDNFTNTGIEVGVNRGGTEYFEGYIRDVRIVKGTTLYNTSETTFTPPTEGLVAVSGSGYSTTLLTCHQPYIADGGANSISPTIYGDVSTKPFSPYDYEGYNAVGHGGSVYFDGSGDYLTIPSSNDFQLGTTGTINFWMYIDTTGNAGIVSGYNNANSLFIYCQNNFNLEWRDNNNAYYSLTGITLSQKVWTYVSIVRSGTTLKVYLNGVEKASQTVSSTSEFGSDENLEIGNRSAIGWTYKGYLSDFQIIKGTAIVPTSSTIPIAPSATHSNSKLHIKGTDASIIDKSQGANLKLVGNTTGSTTQVKFSNTKSIYFDGTGDYITDLPDDLFAFGYDPYTIEFWIYTASYPVYSSRYHIFGSSTSAGNKYAVKLGGGQIDSGNSDGDTNTMSSIVYANMPIAGNWVHVAFVRAGISSNQCKCYINGSQGGQETDNTEWGTATDNTIGATASGNYGFNGYIQDLRVTKGLARYTANFTPPSAPLEG